MKPLESEVTKGLSGKVVFIYGGNRTGKTTNATKAPKPLVLACERGLNAIGGIKYFPIEKWLDIDALVDQLVENKDEIIKQDLYRTIIIDGIDKFCEYADTYLCNMYNVRSIGDGNRGYGLWKEYGNLMSKLITKLTNCGFTVIFIGHDTEKEYGEGKSAYIKIVPRGDKRAWEPICDIADIIGYARVIEDGKPANLYIEESPSYVAGSRFKFLTPIIEDWSYEKLDIAVKEAIEKEEKTSGIEAIDYKDSAMAKEKVVVPLEDIKTEIRTLVEKMAASDPNLVEYQDILSSLLGAEYTEFKVADCTEKQRDLLETILAKVKKVVKKAK
ncbi:MAG: ATP-binding protein [Clostridia bacterium]|nr:ATP-binding protein [Clostridia bacterium]